MLENLLYNFKEGATGYAKLYMPSYELQYETVSKSIQDLSEYFDKVVENVEPNSFIFLFVIGSIIVSAYGLLSCYSNMKKRVKNI